MIRLTDLEIADAYYKAAQDETARLSEKRRAIAKAQIKKVADYIENLPTDGHDKWHFYHKDLAEKIRKEVE